MGSRENAVCVDVMMYPGDENCLKSQEIAGVREIGVISLTLFFWRGDHKNVSMLPAKV